MKAFLKKIPLEIYKKQVYVLWGIKKENKKFFQKAINKIASSHDKTSLHEYLNKFYENEDYDKVGGRNGDGYLPYGNQIVSIVAQKKCPLANHIGVLSHELNHATYHILDGIGVKYSEDDHSHEPFTYLQEYLLNEVLEVVFAK